MNQTVIKKDRIAPVPIKLPGISSDLVGFLFVEIEEHVEKLFDLCCNEEPDMGRAEYHHEKFRMMLQMLKVNKLGGA